MTSTKAMALLLLFVISVGFSGTIAEALPLPASEKLGPGQCFSDPESKNYLQSIKARLDRYPNIVRDIGLEKINSLKDTALTNYYFCQLTCKDQQHEISQIWVTSSDSTERFHLMDGFLCPYVKMENVHVVGSIFTIQPVPQIFYAYNSTLDEVHQWLLQKSFTLSPSMYEISWALAQTQLLSVARDLADTGAMNFMEAGYRLREIANRTEDGNRLLAEYVERLNIRNWKSDAPAGSIDSLVENFLITNLRFAPYHPAPLISP